MSRERGRERAVLHMAKTSKEVAMYPMLELEITKIHGLKKHYHAMLLDGMHSELL